MQDFSMRHKYAALDSTRVRNVTKFDVSIKAAATATKYARHRHKLAAVIMQGGRPVSIGWNHSAIHAEQSVINRSHGIKIVGKDILVVRVRRDGSLGMAKPCLECIKAIKEAGIKSVVFSNKEGKFEVIKL